MPNENLSPEVFTGSVKPLTDFLATKFPDGLSVSDIRDELGRQYVDLVQEGGGVHGIALAGYTYVLEKMNIGFMKMAGTSAGSINTLLLNAVYTKPEAELLRSRGRLKGNVEYYETRSEKVLDYLAKKDLADLVDGHPLWRKLILGIFSPSASGGLKSQIVSVRGAAKAGGLLFVVFLICALCLAFYTQQDRLWQFFRIASIVSAVGLFIIIGYLVSRIVLARLLYKHAETFGINPGKNFEDWLNDILMENGIESVDDLNEKFMAEQEVLQPHFYPAPMRKALHSEAAKVAADPDKFLNTLERVKNPRINVDVLFEDLKDELLPKSTEKEILQEKIQNVMYAFNKRLENQAKEELALRSTERKPPVTRELVIVSSDITHGLKVEFPGMHKMYWGNDYGISPAKYVRASMSVPLFFKPLQVNFNPGQLNVIREEWMRLLKIQKNLEDCALFVDGGLLSNFPINVFYNPSMPVPRKPTFGIKLEYEDESMAKSIKTPMGFAGSLVNTMRFFYDRDFALKHEIYQKTVRSIDTGKVHWLNFNLSAKDKIELFFRGALTATLFLAKHALTEREVQKVIRLGKEVRYNDNVFSIFEGEDPAFRTEDCLISNVTFEWETYKKERLMDRISKDVRKEEIKAESALQKVPQTVSGKIMEHEPQSL